MAYGYGNKRAYSNGYMPAKRSRVPKHMQNSFKAAVAQAAAASANRQRELKGMDTDIDQTDVLATTSTNGSSVVLNLLEQGASSRS